MSDVQSVLVIGRRAVDDMIQTGNQCAASWSSPAAPGKWSPAQVVEHTARSLEEAARDLKGEPSKLPNLPAPLRFVARKLLFERVLKRGAFPRAKTNAAMNPDRGPETPAAGATRLEASWHTFADACVAAARATDRAQSRVFGSVPLGDYIRFQEVHTRHHRGQMVRR